MKKKPMKRLVLALTIVLGAGMLFSGCGLVSVNPDKDREQTLMTIGDQTVTKSDYNNAMASVAMYYEASSQTMPTGSDLKTLQQDTLDNVVQQQVLAAKAKKDGTKVDEEAAKKTGKSSYDSIKKEVDKKYDTILNTYNTNDKVFASYMEDNAVVSEYATKALTAYTDKINKDPSEYLKKSVGTIDGTDVTRGEYNYYYIGQELQYYYTNQTAMATDDASMKKTNQTIFESIGTNRDLIKYCEDNGIEIKDDAIKTAQDSSQSMVSMFFSEDADLSSYLEGYNLTLDKFKEYQKEEAKATAAGEAIQDKMTSDVKVSDNQVKSYYNKNKDKYDTSTVSACHILTEDQDLSKEIYEKAKDCKTKEDFQKIMDEYKGNENVTEATDLGAFTRSTMVEEFSKTAFDMDVNSVSKPVKTTYGYHVIFVYDKSEETSDWESNKDTIVSDIQSEEGTDSFTKLKEKYTKGLKIDIGDIKTATEQYVDELKTELNVTVNDKVIG